MNPSSRRPFAPVFALGWTTLTAICFVAGDALTKWATTGRSDAIVLQILAIRVVFGFLLICVLGLSFKLFTRGNLAGVIPTPKTWGSPHFIFLYDYRAFLRAIAFCLAIGFFAFSFKYNNMVEVYVIAYLSPVLVLFLSRYIFEERLRWSYFILIGLMLAGALGMKYYGAESHLGWRVFISEASMYAWATMFCYALFQVVSQVTQRHLETVESASPTSTGMTSVFRVASLMSLSVFFWGALLLGLAALAIYPVRAEAIRITPDFFAAISIAAATSVLGIFSYTMAVQYGTATEVAAYLYLEVVIAAGIEYLIWSRTLNFSQSLCALLVIGAAFCLAWVRHYFAPKAAN